MRSIYQEHYASYLFKVEGDGDAAYEYREAHMPEGWEGNHIQLRELAAWCLKQGVVLPQARALAQRVAQVTEIPMIRLMSMMLEARIASAAGDHDDAVELMETIDRAVPDNQTVMSLLESFRKLATESGSRPSTRQHVHPVPYLRMKRSRRHRLLRRWREASDRSILSTSLVALPD